MHSRGGVTDMATFTHATYERDVVARRDRRARARPSVAAKRAGIERERVVWIRASASPSAASIRWRCWLAVSRIVALGFPVLVGVSRKRFIGELTGTVIATERVWGTVGRECRRARPAVRGSSASTTCARTAQALDVAWAIMSKR